MRRFTLVIRGLAFHRRSHLAVGLGVIVGTATLTGALLVGDSMRLSLRDHALGRLGRVDYALTAPRFFGEDLVARLAESPGFTKHFAEACPAILARGGISHADSRTRVNRITILGVDDRFWSFAVEGTALVKIVADRSVILNKSLANSLAAQVGDDILIRMGRPSPISTETLLGRRDDTSVTLRLTVRRVIPNQGLGSFDLTPRQALPNNAWVPLATLQRALQQVGRVNAILVAGQGDAEMDAEDRVAQLHELLKQRVELGDAGLSVRVNEALNYAALESDSMLVEPVLEQAALASATVVGAAASPVLTYLANTITAGAEHLPESTSTRLEKAPPASPSESRRVIPYSTIAAVETGSPILSRSRSVEGSALPPLQPGEILLNKWAADDLQAAVGDRVTLSYYITEAHGRLATREVNFVLRGIVNMGAWATDTGFTPEYHGVTDAKSLSDWDPPFSIDLGIIREKDEDYWDQFQAAPKAFISLADGRRLWTEGHERFGQATSVRLMPNEDTDVSAMADAFRAELLRQVSPADLGLSFRPVRQQAMAASRGTTDFGMLFVGFSFFLIISAALLVALLFRLGAERRARELGILLATGFRPAAATRLFLAEGSCVAIVGCVVGLLAAAGYASLMLTGLKTWWAAAANTPFLRLYILPWTVLIGFAASFIVAILSLAGAVRTMRGLPVQELLAGATTGGSQIAPRHRSSIVAAGGSVALTLAIILVVLASVTEAVPATVGFFGGGAAMVVACLGALTLWLSLTRRKPVRHSGYGTFIRLGARNAARNPGRSLLTAGLISSATFIIVAMEAFHLGADLDPTKRDSPTGGFTLLAEAAVPLPYDVNSPDGREALNITGSAVDRLLNAKAFPFRLRSGDETSCLSLYRPTEPRMIGASDALIDRGGFVFSATMAESDAERRNPWTLLRRDFPDRVIPVIGDEAAVKWQLHSGVGQEITITDERGREARLRFVALLAGSVLQNELVIAESRFVELFPSIDGHAFFLIETPPHEAAEVAGTLESVLSTYAFDVTSTKQRLAAFQTVQNTYLSTFQTLGGLGLVLGTAGLAVVMLRNIGERRGELALMRALGFSRRALAWMVLAENGVLVLSGLAAGAIPAFVAIAPHVLARPAEIPWWSIALTLVGVFSVGIGAGAFALVPALRVPLVPALRRE